MLTSFNEHAQKAIVIAESIAFDLGHSSVGSEHLLLGILKMKDSDLSRLLLPYQVNDEVIQEDIERLFGKESKQPFFMEYSDVVKNVLDDALMITKEKQLSKVSLNDLTISLLSQEACVSSELLKKYHIPVFDIIEELENDQSYIDELDRMNELVNLNKKVLKENRTIIGREKQLQQLCSILCKKEKSNALIIGYAGVGKSALVEKLADCINKDNVPLQLKDKVIYELSLSSIVAGTKYRGEFEEKLKRIISEVVLCKNVILFIDEIHNLIGAGGAEGAIDASNILKPYLARGEVTLIGATTLEEYYKYFEKDQAVNRRFTTIQLPENTKEETIKILEGIVETYADYHQIEINKDLIDQIVEDAIFYYPNRKLPDSAIDLLDLSCVKCLFFKEPVLTHEHVEEVIKESGQAINIALDEEEIYDKLKQEIIGQDDALKTIVHNSKVYQSLYKDKNRPNCIMMLTGESGIGKSESVRVFAQAMNCHLIVMNMSEYSDSFSTSKIIGAPNGYIGYDDQSYLKKELAIYPRSVILLDEVEKAHQDVLHLFLQVFDQGVLKDNHNNDLIFRHTYIFLTSNASINDSKKAGFKKQKQSMNTLKDYFSKEFISRIDEIITFKSLTKKDYIDIIKKTSHNTLSYEEMNIIVKNHQKGIGARGLIRETQKYIVNK